MGFDAEPGRWRWVLAAAPFVAAAVAYLWLSHARIEANPYDKLMPSPGRMWEAFRHAAFDVDGRTGTLLLWDDWTSSMERLVMGVGAAAAVGLLIGLNTGLFPAFDAAVTPFVTVASIIPPLALLPILFITFGVGEVGKTVLIFAGLVWTISRDVRQYVAALPVEQVTKGLTLGGTQAGIAYRLVLPQAWPRLVSSVRLNMGGAWLFLIASEAIAASDGLGYRIFLVRRYLAMDLILPYVAVITVTGFAMDYGLRTLNRRVFPWYEPPGEGRRG